MMERGEGRRLQHAIAAPLHLYRQGIPIAYLSFVPSLGTISRSHNVSSVTTVGTGDFTINMIAPALNDNIVASGQSGVAGTATAYVGFKRSGTVSATTIDLQIVQQVSTDALFDTDQMSLVILGRNAVTYPITRLAFRTWGYIDEAGGVPSLSESSNISSIVDLGVGSYFAGFINPFFTDYVGYTGGVDGANPETISTGFSGTNVVFTVRSTGNIAIDDPVTFGMIEV